MLATASGGCQPFRRANTTSWVDNMQSLSLTPTGTILDRFFLPKSVAVIGASRHPGKVGHDILVNLRRDGYTGAIVPVNPNADMILDLPCYPSLTACGKEIDLVVVAVPVESVIHAMEEAGRARVKAAIVVTSGFREDGESGAALEKQLAELCIRNSIRLLGPNCLGIINTANRLNASFGPRLPVAGNLSVFSQSGAILTSMIDLAASRHLGLAKVISVGNKTDITEVELLSALAKDEQTGVIIGYLEDISTGDKFVKAAEEAADRKPVIILKAGTTEAGLRTAASHTGVLASSDTAYGAAFKRSGVVRADTFGALYDYASALSLQPLPKGDRVLIIANAGGPATLAADAVERAGMRLAGGSRTAIRLREQQPRTPAIEIPVDILGGADTARYVAALEAGQADPEVDAILLVLSPQVMNQPADTAMTVAHHMDGSKPVVAVFLGGGDLLPGGGAFAASGMPDYDSPERAVAALKAMYEYALEKQAPSPRHPFRANKRRVERIITRQQRKGLLQSVR